MKKDAINTFTDGLVMDLNPLNTPNTVMTDCLNGTLLTYNGNELSLQNDMGNYLLKNCQLPEFYVPIGVKEYAGILYLVLYNPFSKTVEIGSYPSTRQVIDLESSRTGSTVYLFEGESGRYSDIVSNMKECVFSWGGETYIINPGDIIAANKYYMEDDYQKVEYFIRDEYNFDHNVTSDMNEIFKKGSGRASWLVSGKLIAKPRFAELNSMSVVPEIDFNDLSNSVVSFSVTSYDKLFNNSDVKLYVEYQTEIDANKTTSIEKLLTPKQFDNKVIFESNNISLQTNGLNEMFRIKSTPILKYNNKQIKYDTLTVTKTIYNNIERSYQIGDAVFQYQINTGDNPSFDLWFNVDRIDGSNTNWIDEEIYSVKCSLLLPNGNPVKNCADIKCNLDNSLSEDHNIMRMQTTSFVSFDKETYSEHKDYFYKENVYIAQIVLMKKNTAIYSRDFVIITSELLNGFKGSYRKYYDIPYNLWLQKYEIKLPTTLNSELISWDSTASNFYGPGYDAILQDKLMDPDVPMFTDGYIDYHINPKLQFDLNIIGNYRANLKCDNFLCGPIWINCLKYAIFSFGGTSYRGLIDEYSGKVVFTTPIEYQTSTAIPFNYKLRSVGEGYKNIYRYKGEQLKIAEGSLTIVGYGLEENTKWNVSYIITINGMSYEKDLTMEYFSGAWFSNSIPNFLSSELDEKYSIVALAISLNGDTAFKHQVFNPYDTEINNANGKYLVAFRINSTREYIANIYDTSEYYKLISKYNYENGTYYKGTGQGEWVEIEKDWDYDEVNTAKIKNTISKTCVLGQFLPIRYLESGNINLPHSDYTMPSQDAESELDIETINLSADEWKLINDKEAWAISQNIAGNDARENYDEFHWTSERYENIPSGPWASAILKGYYLDDRNHEAWIEDYYKNAKYWYVKTTCDGAGKSYAKCDLAKFENDLLN